MAFFFADAILGKELDFSFSSITAVISAFFSFAAFVFSQKSDSKDSFIFDVKLLLAEYDILVNDPNGDVSSWCNDVKTFVNNYKFVLKMGRKCNSILYSHVNNEKKHNRTQADEFAKILRSLL